MKEYNERLAAIWGSWARYVYDAAPHRFVKFALDVMGLSEGGMLL